MNTDVQKNERKEESRETAFIYSYTAAQQEEIEQIRKKYLQPQEDKMEQLRRLDRGVTRRGTMVSIIVGVISCLIMGTGMSCVMVGPEILFLPGMLIGIVGLIGVSIAYPLYCMIVRKDRDAIAPMILELTEELSRGK